MSEEIKKELLSNDDMQTHIILYATISALMDKLIEKDIMSVKDFEDMDKKQKEYIETMNNRIIAKATERMKGEIEHE